MDFKKLYLIIKGNIKFISIFTIFVLIAVLLFSWWTSGGYDVSVSLSVFSKVIQQTPDYQYDGYYSVKAANEFADTVSQWTKSPEIINSIYKKAGVDFQGKSLRSFSGIFKAQKMAPQYIEIRFRVQKTEDALRITKALADVLQEKAELSSNFSGNVVFTIIGGQPITAPNQPNFIFNGLLAIIGGLLLSLLAVLLKENDNWN